MRLSENVGDGEIALGREVTIKSLEVTILLAVIRRKLIQ